MRPSGDQVWTQQHRRTYTQLGGSRPDKQAFFSGIGAQRSRVEGVSIPDGAGGIEPIWMPSPRRAGRYQQAGQMQSPPDQAEGTLIFAEELGAGIPRQFARLGCLTLYELGSPCADLTDFTRGWEGHLVIYENGRVNGNKDMGARTSYDSDEMLEGSVPMVFESIYAVGEIGFGEVAASLVNREVMDAVFGVPTSCDDCDPDLDARRRYAVARSSGTGSPGLPAIVLYTVDGVTWLTKTIDGIGATEDPVAMEIVGSRLVVLTRTAGGATTGGYYWSNLNTKTGVPGTFTKVTSGFVASRQPNDIYVAHAGAVYICADGGYVYLSSDIPAGVSVVSAGDATTNNLYRIDGMVDTVVAGGASSTVIKTTNAGATWATTTDSSASDVALDITALEVMSKDFYWVGTTNSGRLIYTRDGGETWVDKPYGPQGSGDIQDILFITPSVGYIAYNTDDPVGRLYATVDGGNTWTNEAPRVGALPTIDYVRRIAAPVESDDTRACNILLLAGLGGNGTDGTLIAGAAPMR